MLGIRRNAVSSVLRRRSLLSDPSTTSSSITLMKPRTTPSSLRLVARRSMAEMPLPQSATAVLFDGHETNEGWETTIYWWYATSFIMICAILGMEPETGIDAWANKEARVRLAMKDAGFEGPFVFGKHYQSLTDEAMKGEWDTFSKKALRMNEDDDDDDDDEEDEDGDNDDEDE